MKSVVVDTNVFMSALIGSPACNTIVDAAIDTKIKLITSKALIDEFVDTLHKPKFVNLIPPEDSRVLISFLKNHAVLIKPRHHVRICRDAKDNFLLELALSSDCDCVVSGDNDLLALSPFRNIPIITPAEFVTTIK